MRQQLLPRNGTLQLPLALAGREKLLQFIWQFGYYNKSGLVTADGQPLSVIFPGSLNKNQGPDFLSAKIRIGNTLLAGSVELHLKTSDWQRHCHEGDEHYKNVILHVVFNHDETVNGIPVLPLCSRISGVLLDRYACLMDRRESIACGRLIQNVKDLVWRGWKERLLAERLARKAQAVLQLFTASNHHWEETCWWLLARQFGGKINGDAFEAMARSIPLNLLSKHKTSIHQLEALLLGQSGLLEEEFEDLYPQMLQREYRFLKKKYGLLPSAQPVLFLRMRPGGFPTVRLAQLAALLHQTTHLFSKITEASKPDEIKNLFMVTANDFWNTHYTLQQTSASKPKAVGEEAVQNIIINGAAPLLFAYGLHRKDEAFKEKALRWLAETPPEKNGITREFEALGISSGSAYDSQSLIELKNGYCCEKKCLQCAVGNSILREAAAEYGSNSHQ